jgi:hypothetical protein
VWQVKRLREETGRAQCGDAQELEEKRIGQDQSAMRQTRERIAEKYR